YASALRFMAASCAMLGRHEQAQKAMTHLRALDPALRISNLRQLTPFARAEDFDRWAEGLRLAGLPEWCGMTYAPPCQCFPALLTALSGQNNNSFEALAVFLRSEFSFASLTRRRKAHFSSAASGLLCLSARRLA